MVRPEIPVTEVAPAISVFPMTRIVPEVLKGPAPRTDVAMPRALAARVIVVVAPTVPVARVVRVTPGFPVTPGVPVMTGLLIAGEVTVGNVVTF